MKYILTIVGDENDADYLTSQKEVEMNEIVNFPHLKDYRENVYTASIQMISFINTFASACRKNPRGNWTRLEFDDIHEGAGKTISFMIRKLYGITVDQLNERNSGDTTHSDTAIEQWFEFLNDYLPYGEFGVHTIESISFVPVESEVIVYKRKRK